MNGVHASSHADQCLALLAGRDRDSRQMYAEYLRHAAFDVEEAEDGREALAIAISRNPQIIVTETQLPGIDGFRLCELLRSDQNTQGIPIIVVTPDVYPADISRAERAGADAVLAVPCLPERLLAEIHSCLSKSDELRKRAHVARAGANEQIARSTRELEKSRAIRTRMPLSRIFNRHTTTAPPMPPPVLVCPSCDTPLAYRDSHIGGVSEHHIEQWDYYQCPAKCGTFQYRQRTRKLRKLT